MTFTIMLEGRIARQGVDLSLTETLAILDGIAEDAALKGAARRARLSYRAIWGKIARIEALAGQPVARRVKGHGTRLTPAGEALRGALAAALARLEPTLASEAAALATALPEPPAGQGGPPLVLAASHDPLLAEAVRGMPGIRLDIMGSAEAIAALKAGRAQFAGCHFGTVGDDPPPPLAADLRAAGFAWRVLFRRAQGLMVAPGNPLGLAGLPDLVTRRARFVNRQRGSGTRLWFDRLLDRHAIRPADITGYADEEFTHHAVAAVIAAGRADAGMGAEAAAARFGLDFLRLGEESYFGVFANAASASPRIVGVLTKLNSCP
jgi:putative molybdopterin biosynthesis protein